MNDLASTESTTDIIVHQFALQSIQIPTLVYFIAVAQMVVLPAPKHSVDLPSIRMINMH